MLVRAECMVQYHQALPFLEPGHKILLCLIGNDRLHIVKHKHIPLSGRIGSKRRTRMGMLDCLKRDVRVVLEQFEERLLLKTVSARNYEHPNLGRRIRSAGASCAEEGKNQSNREQNAQTLHAAAFTIPQPGLQTFSVRKSRARQSK